MGTNSARSRATRGRWWGLVLAAFVIVLLAAAAPASAAPPPALGLDDLQAELTAHGSIDGFMKTSMSGTSVSNIPVKILAIVDGFYWGKLIMFESTDPAITAVGGIAAGMSGSPVYVDLGSGDQIIGAVSYGDAFTLRGTGLATPIEYMTSLQDKYAAGAQTAPAATAVKLDRPISTSAGVVRRLVLGAAGTTAADTQVMHPLAEARITGLSTGSTAYRKLAKKLADSGLTVLSGEATAGGVTPALEPGSPCGVVFSTGRYAISVLGTTTYVDGDTALLFGHPVLGGYGMDLGLGPIEGSLVGATVGAVWPSANTPYKMMTPADAKGVAVQDRSAGMVARLTGTIATFPVTTHGSLDGGPSVTDVTDLGGWFATTYYPEIVGFGDESRGITTYTAAAGLYHALGSDPLAGSATTTTTVVVSDGKNDYTITRDNVWDNNGDDTGQGLADAAAGDVATIMANVLDDPYGVRDVKVKSVDVRADFASTRRYAGIADATITRAIRAGANRVSITYYRTGSTEPQTMHATLDVPSGTELDGSLFVMSATSWSEYFTDYSSSESGTSGAPLTLAETKELIDGTPTNGAVVVAYVPSSSEEADISSGPTAAAETIVPGDWVFSGGVQKETASVTAQARGTASLGEPIRLSGSVRRASKDVPVAIYCQEAGKPEPTRPTVTVTAEQMDGLAEFATVLPGFKHNVLITAEVGALSDHSLPGADQLTVKVRAATRLAVRRRGGRLVLTARVSPADADGQVIFQRQVHGRWIPAGAVKLHHGSARTTVSGRGVTRVRARFGGGSTNAAGRWTAGTVK